MQAIILAAGRDMIKQYPACLAPLAETSILSKQISLFQKIGINKIIIVIGKDSKCWTLNYRKHVKKMGVTVIENKDNHFQGNTKSLKLALMKSLDTHTIICDGDTFFNQLTIVKIINNKFDNVLLSRITNILTDSGTKILIKGNRVKDIGKNLRNDDPPWFMYGGLMKINKKLQKKLVSILKNKKEEDEFFTNSISEIIKTNSTNIKFYVQQISSTINSSLILKGGSYAGIKKISLVRKETIKWKQKLDDEMHWIENLPKDLSPYFPKILNKGESKNATYYDMPYFAYPSIRKLIFRGEVDILTVSSLLRNITEFMFLNVYSKDIAPANTSYQKKIHLSRIKKRILDTKKNSLTFNNIIDCNKILINGEEFLNVTPLINFVEDSHELISILTPKSVSKVHGDLHFDNVLVNRYDEHNPNFIFIDPRGLEKTYNYSYDIGKIFHSIHGMYDVIHEGLYDLKINYNNSLEVTLLLKDYPIMQFYQALQKEFIGFLENSQFLKNDKYWIIRTLFAEASHFCSVMPFHLKKNKNEKLAVSLYLIGVILLNQFIKSYESSKLNGVLDQNKFLNNCKKIISRPLSIIFNGK
tara:strand:+ start:21308 stop:23062 length:1755 start_codon:yes stop_codon:yes gene_type:complete